ncbi:MAG TPA: protein-disulfide reductase DsbD domain-containing protein [Vicinamibacterales bacterium]|nr:protein-disulfide reductase DsbD domain-containing protein [Vicinamibacterales bacterium]
MIRQSVAFGLAVVVCQQAHAQIRRPKPEIALMADADGVRSGSSARFALTVDLPESLHVQSNTPRDPSLIPTTLTATAPPGVTVAEVAYPAVSEFHLAGSSQTLAVYGHHFTIGIAVRVASSIAAGDIAVPLKLRYQACDASSCFPPATEPIQWTLHVVGADAPITPQHADAFDAIHFTSFAGDSNGR